jgi:hypothetical protein
MFSSSGYLGILEGDEILSVNNIDIEQAEDDIVDLQNALAGIYHAAETRISLCYKPLLKLLINQPIKCDLYNGGLSMALYVLMYAVFSVPEPFISLRLRSLREEVPEQIRKTTESFISTLVCPPPPRTRYHVT